MDKSERADGRGRIIDTGAIPVCRAVAGFVCSRRK